MKHTPNEPRARSEQRRGATRVLELAVGGCFLLLASALAATVMPTRYETVCGRTTCQSNLRQLSCALKMYAEDYEEVLPRAEAWRDELFPYVKNDMTFQCVKRPQLPDGYAVNVLLDKRPLDSVLNRSLAPSLFDSRLDRRNAADRLESFTTHETVGGAVAFLDGHVTYRWHAPPADAGLQPKVRN